MSHITKKVRIQKDKNNRNRAFNSFNTGTRDMGKTRNEKKDLRYKKEIRSYGF